MSDTTKIALAAGLLALVFLMKDGDQQPADPTDVDEDGDAGAATDTADSASAFEGGAEAEAKVAEATESVAEAAREPEDNETEMSFAPLNITPEEFEAEVSSGHVDTLLDPELF